MTFKTRTISYDMRVRTFWFLSFIFVASIIIYMIAIRATISNTITRANLETTTSALATQVGNMEFQYIGLANNVSLQLAYQKGFQNVTEPIYISRSSSQALSMNISSSRLGTVNR